MTSSETTFNDEELIARLLDFDRVTVGDARDAAYRIEALIEESARRLALARSEGVARVEQFEHIEALEAKLAKAGEALGMLSDYENLDKSGGYYDGECRIFSYQARQRYGDFDDIARATLAEIKGESHE
jgi:hypothetical protein